MVSIFGRRDEAGTIAGVGVGDAGVGAEGGSGFCGWVTKADFDNDMTAFFAATGGPGRKVDGKGIRRWGKGSDAGCWGGFGIVAVC